MRSLIRLIESFLLPEDDLERAAEALAELIRSSNSGTGYIAFQMGCRDDPYGETDEECWEREFPDWCRSAIQETFSRITARFQNGKLRIWRMITAPTNWKPKRGEMPGIYWSYEENAAQAHWGDYNGDHVEWMLTAEVTFDQIDWPTTLSQNAMPDYEEEKEIRLSVNVVPFRYKRRN